MMGDVDVRPRHARTLDDLLRADQGARRQAKPVKWVLARGYDQFELDVKRHPHRSELDAIAPNNPVYLVRGLRPISRWSIQGAGARLGHPSTRRCRRGAIEQVNGVLTGLLARPPRRDPIKIVPARPLACEELVAAIERPARYWQQLRHHQLHGRRRRHAVGLPRDRRLYARRGGRAGCRSASTSACWAGRTASWSAASRRARLRRGDGDDMLRVGPVKIFTDGSAGGRTAAMTSPYLGEPRPRGSCSSRRRDGCADPRLSREGLPARKFHAIGDAAHRAADAFRDGEKALARHPDPDRRHRIEHCGFNTDDQMRRMKAAGIEPVPQPIFIHDFGDLYRSVLGDGRPEASYPMKTWIDRGFRPAASTDARRSATPIPSRTSTRC